MRMRAGNKGATWSNKGREIMSLKATRSHVSAFRPIDPSTAAKDFAVYTVKINAEARKP